MTDLQCAKCENPAIIGSTYCGPCAAEVQTDTARRAADAQRWDTAFDTGSPVLAGPTVAQAEPLKMTPYPKLDYVDVTGNPLPNPLPTPGAASSQLSSVPLAAPMSPAAYQQPFGAGSHVVGRKSKIAAGLLAIFLGSLGIHNFYLGRTSRGLVQLLVTVLGGIITLGIASAAMGLWSLIEGIMILTAQPGSSPWGVDALGQPLNQ